MIAGIVCEYNPFHKGHLYHIEKTKSYGADYIVCVMSGNFVQRGECAYFDKWLRAEAAVRCGADIVIDLPVPWACGSAESFARGSIGLLCNFGIDLLSFGSECDDEEILYRCAEALDDERVGAFLKNKTAEGMSYPFALSEAVGEIYGEKERDILSSPNSTLAVEYIRALKHFSPDIKILPVKRKGSDHDDANIKEGIASASKIRSFSDFKEAEEFIPGSIYPIFLDAVRKDGISSMKKGERAVISALREMKKEEYALYVTDETGLSNRIYEAVKTAATLDEIYEKAKTKNYTHSRVRREVISLYLKIPKDISKGKVPYMRILAASERGLSLLGKAKENSSVPVITKHSEMSFVSEEAKRVYEIQCISSDKFALFSDKIKECSLEQKHSMIKVNID